MANMKAKTSITKTTTPDGRDGWRIECTCTTHPKGKTAAVVVAHSGTYNAKLVHGTVLGAHHPAKVISEGLRRKGIWAA